MKTEEKQALKYFAFQNDATKKIDCKIIETLVQLNYLYRVGANYYCTDSGADKAFELLTPSASKSKLFYHPTYEKRRKDVA